MTVSSRLKKSNKVYMSALRYMTTSSCIMSVGFGMSVSFPTVIDSACIKKCNMYVYIIIIFFLCSHLRHIYVRLLMYVKKLKTSRLWRNMHIHINICCIKLNKLILLNFCCWPHIIKTFLKGLFYCYRETMTDINYHSIGTTTLTISIPALHFFKKTTIFLTCVKWNVLP